MQYEMVQSESESDIEALKRFAETYNAFSSKAAKQNAFAVIREEVSSLRSWIIDLKQQIKRCELSIISWKSRHNSLNDISRLPDDILVEIWKHLAHKQMDEIPTRWIGVTHVCAHWRRVALGCPILWSWPCVHRPDLFAAMLKRAGTSKLTLLLNHVALARTTYADRSRIVALVSPVLPRVESVVLNCSPSSSFDSDISPLTTILQRLKLENATKLEYLGIFYSRQGTRHATQLGPFINRLVHSNHLKYIIFRDHTLFRTPSTKPSSLNLISHLHITLRYDYSHASSLRAVLTALEHMQNLERLTLIDAFLSLTNEEAVWCKDNMKPVNLHKLKALKVSASAQSSHLFLDLVTYPSTTYTYLRGLGDDQTNGLPFLESVKQVVTICANRMAPSIKFLDIWKTDRRLGLLFRHRTDESTQAVSPCLEILMPLEMEILPELTSLCPLKQLKYLEYKLPTSDMAMWRSFGLLENLEIVSLKTLLLAHPTLQKVLTLIRYSNDTIFDPWSLHLCTPVHNPQYLTAEELLYYPGVRVINEGLADVPTELSIVEEYKRIMYARCFWREYLKSGVMLVAEVDSMK